MARAREERPQLDLELQLAPEEVQFRRVQSELEAKEEQLERQSAQFEKELRLKALENLKAAEH